MGIHVADISDFVKRKSLSTEKAAVALAVGPPTIGFAVMDGLRSGHPRGCCSIMGKILTQHNIYEHRRTSPARRGWLHKAGRDDKGGNSQNNS
jgi:hypothetical protein